MTCMHSRPLVCACPHARMCPCAPAHARACVRICGLSASERATNAHVDSSSQDLQY